VQPRPKNDLRECAVKLRTEVDLLRVDFDVTRGSLLDALKEARELVRDRDAAAAEFRAAIEQGMLVAVAGGLNPNDEIEFEKRMKEIEFSDRGLNKRGFKVPKDLFKVLKGDSDSRAAVDRAIETCIKDVEETLRLSVAQQQTEFARLARRLNEKKLDLAEAEAVFQREAR
jgi:hypothetical protein